MHKQRYRYLGIDLNDLIVIETRDAILISRKESSQKVKNIVKNGIACVPNLKTSEFLNKLITDTDKEYFVECSLNEKFKKWQPIKESTFMSQADEL